MTDRCLLSQTPDRADHRAGVSQPHSENERHDHHGYMEPVERHDHQGYLKPVHSNHMAGYSTPYDHLTQDDRTHCA